MQKVGKHIDIFVDIYFYVTSYEYKNFSNTDFYQKNPLFFIREEKVKTLLKGKPWLFSVYFGKYIEELEKWKCKVTLIFPFIQIPNGVAWNCLWHYQNVQFCIFMKSTILKW